MKNINVNKKDAKLLIVGACLGIVLKKSIDKGVDLLSDVVISKIINHKSENESFDTNESASDKIKDVREYLDKEDKEI